MQTDRVWFSTYQSPEILALSVKEIINPETFDNLGHPNRGGLYDPSLGGSIIFVYSNMHIAIWESSLTACVKRKNLYRTSYDYSIKN